MTTCALANPACQKQPDERNLMTGGAPIQLIHCHTTVIIGDTLSHQIIIIIIVSGNVMIISVKSPHLVHCDTALDALPSLKISQRVNYWLLYLNLYL